MGHAFVNEVISAYEKVCGLWGANVVVAGARVVVVAGARVVVVAIHTGILEDIQSSIAASATSSPST